MNNIFEKIKHDWLDEASSRINATGWIRFNEHLSSIFDIVVDSINNESYEKLESFLSECLNSRMVIDPSVYSLNQLICILISVTFDVASKSLNNADAMKLICQITPVWTFAIEAVSKNEVLKRSSSNQDDMKKDRLIAEKLDDSKSEFISIAAHELRTPLTLIEGYASMLDDVIPHDYISEQTDICIGGIKAGTLRLREIVDDMIDISMIDNGLLSLTYQPVWLNRLVNQIMRDLNSTIRERNLNIEIKPFQGSDELIFGDGERLFQALKNVITNAIKYTPDGGDITIGGRLLPGYIETIITDTGIGINPEDHLRIFEKFGRVGNVSLHSSGKLKYKGGGPGLGLPITKGIIEAHGGAIWVESLTADENRCPGSSFHILIPNRKTPPDDKGSEIYNQLINDL